MKKIIMILIFICSTLFANEYKGERPKNIDKSNFIDKIQSEDANVQSMIDQLKEDFHNQRSQIDDKYDIKKETLKKQKQQEMQQLKKAFRKKMKKLRDKYPKKIKSDKTALTPQTPFAITKMLNKKTEAETAKAGENNSLEKNNKPSKKACGINCTKSCCNMPVPDKKEKKPLKKSK
jgi:LPS O-antigen subunit length determinant protein (WzzB/FepE family)